MLQNPPAHAREGFGIARCRNKVNVRWLAVGTQRDLPVPPTGRAYAKVLVEERTTGNATPEHGHSPYPCIVDCTNYINQATLQLSFQ
jgi:anti-sigma factor ChrR (cupin superfamily)